TSEFLNDAHKFWVRPLDLKTARELAERGDPADVEAVVAEVGGLAYGGQWLGGYLYGRAGGAGSWRGAVSGASERVLGSWGGRVRWGDERQLWKGWLGGDVAGEGVDAPTRGKLRGLVKRGLLVEVEKEQRFVVEGVAWREFVGRGG